MELKGNTLPGYHVYEYMLIINPHEALQEKIKSVRSDFENEFKTDHKIGGRPNVGLVQWMQYEMMEKRIVDKLKLVSLGYAPFKIELRDFGSYPSHSIFIKMVSIELVKKLIRAIREQAQSLMKLNKETKPHFFDESNITIARKLLPWQYEKAWLEYSHKHFMGRFIADGMLLLKRAADKSSPWQIVERFEFANQLINVHAEQGELF
jgi:2'-5' RNA ligase